MTEDTMKLFGEFVEMSPEWGGQPLCDINSNQRGNLLDLKKKGLVETIVDGEVFIIFTEKGGELAEKLFGINPKSYEF